MAFNVYIDGLNLYKGFLSKQPKLKWLDLKLLSENLMASDDIGSINYFTSPMKKRFRDDLSPQRQATYLRVLKHQGINVVNGSTVRYEKWLRHTSKSQRDFVEPQMPKLMGLSSFAIRRVWQEASPDSPKSKVRLFAEKASDVNLASYLLRDTLSSGVKIALIISGDTDLVTAINFSVLNGTFVRVVIPNSAQQGARIARVASSTTYLDYASVKQSQLPKPFVTTSGSKIFPPDPWC